MSLRGFTNWRAYGTQIKEADYGDGLSIIDSSFNMDANNTVEEQNQFSNAEEVTGLEEASEIQVLSESNAHSHAQRAQSHAVAFFGAAAWGAHTTTEVSSLAAGRVYRHDIRLTTVPGVLHTFGYVENRSGLVREYNGNAINRLAISGERNAHTRLEVDVMGSGSFVDVSTSRPAILTADPFLRSSEAKVFFGTGTIAAGTLTQSTTLSDISGPPSELDCVLMSYAYELSNNLMSDTDSYGFGTGPSRCQLEREQRSQTLSAALEFDGTNLELERLRNLTSLAMEIDNKSGVEVVIGSGFFYGFNLAFPLLKVQSAAITGGRGKQIMELAMTPLEQAISAPNLRPAMLSVWNANSAYLL